LSTYTSCVLPCRFYRIPPDQTSLPLLLLLLRGLEHKSSSSIRHLSSGEREREEDQEAEEETKNNGRKRSLPSSSSVVVVVVVVEKSSRHGCRAMNTFAQCFPRFFNCAPFTCFPCHPVARGAGRQLIRDKVQSLKHGTIDDFFLHLATPSVASGPRLAASGRS
jgi:hypothetical protein